MREDGTPTFANLAYLRNLFGISTTTSGLHLYENAGLAHFDRNRDNNYRSYTIPDVVLLCNAVDYTHYGYTLRETSDILLDSDLLTQLARLDEMNGRFLDQFDDLLAKKHRIEEERSALAAYISDPFACYVRDDLDLYQLPIHDKRIDMGDAKRDSGAWWQCAPFVTTGMQVLLKSDAPADTLQGPVADGHEVRRLGLPTFDAVRFCSPGQLCLRAFAHTRADQVPDASDYAHITAYLRANGLERTSATVLHRLLRFHQEGGLPLRIDEAFVTVKRVAGPAPTTE